MLLITINYFMAIVRYYLPIERLKDVLVKRKWYGLDYLIAALMGMVTPFCSCSSIPLFVGFLNAGIPIGVTFTFLIASPLINESSLFIFPAVFGLKTTIIYNLLGVAVSIAGGLIIQKFGGEKYVNPDLLKLRTKKQLIEANQGQKISFKKLVVYWWSDAMSITKRIFLYVLFGVAIGAVIHGVVPSSFIEEHLSRHKLISVPLATLLGIPLYANSVSVIPVIEALTDKGIPLGTALAFMTATVTLSIPEALILKKVMHWKLLSMFFGITTIGIILMGIIFNLS